jgi:hypothetical protein
VFAIIAGCAGIAGAVAVTSSFRRCTAYGMRRYGGSIGLKQEKQGYYGDEFHSLNII